MSTEIYARSHYEAGMDIDYAIALSELHQRFFWRLKRLISLLSVVGGSSAFIGAIGQKSSVAAICGLAVALISMIDLVFDFGGLADAHRRDKQDFLKLKGRMNKMSIGKIDSELAKIREDAASTFDSLHRPVFNENLMRHGRPEYMTGLTWWEKLCRVFV